MDCPAAPGTLNILTDVSSLLPVIANIYQTFLQDKQVKI